MAKEGPNWDGLLKWSLANSDGTKPTRNLSEEDRKWFMEAMQAQTIDVVKRMKEITLVMQTPEEVLQEHGVTPTDIEDMLDELQEHVEAIDMANDLHSIGGLGPLLNYLRNSHAAIRAKAADVVSTIVQNNPKSQQLVMEANGLEPLLSNFSSDPDITVRTQALGAISSLIRNNRPGVAAFRLANGYASLRDALSSDSVRFQRREEPLKGLKRFRLFVSKKPGSNPAPNFCRLNRNFLVQSPSAAIGFWTLGAVRHYHKYRGPPLALKDYSKFARFMKHVKEYKKICIVGLGIVTIFTIGSWETIPYSKRKHFVLIPPSKGTSFGNFISRTREEIFVLPQDHPDSVRVRSISNKILRALQSDLKIKEMTGLEYSSRNITSDVDEKEAAVPWWRRTKFSTRHLEGLDWEVVVVDRYLNNAYVLPGGKIVVYKYLLKSCKSDDQVAAVIDHEVGHVVARHYAERFTKSLWFAIGLMIIFSGGSVRSPPPHPLGTRKLAELVLNPCSRSNEKEADYIGLLLMASAGYDPREAPKVFEMPDPPDDSSKSKFKFIRDFFRS